MKHSDPHDRDPHDREPTTYDELDVRLDTAFDTLPRERAGDDFTDRVLRRLPANDERFSGEGLTTRSWTVAVAALLLLAVTFGVREWNHRREMRQSIERIAEMRAEYWELERELGELRQKRRAAEPVVYLGEVDGTEVVLDLSAFPDARSRLQALGLLRSGVVPAVSGEGDEVLYATDEPEPVFY